MNPTEIDILCEKYLVGKLSEEEFIQLQSLLADDPERMKERRKTNRYLLQFNTYRLQQEYDELALQSEAPVSQLKAASVEEEEEEEDKASESAEEE